MAAYETPAAKNECRFPIDCQSGIRLESVLKGTEAVWAYETPAAKNM